MSEPLLQLDNVTKQFPVRRGPFGTKAAMVLAVDGVSWSLQSGRTLGVVGESGCGKTTMAKLVLGLEQPTGGTLVFQGRDTSRLDRAGRAHFRRSVQAVMQDPSTSLNPRLRVETLVGEPLVVNGANRGEARKKVCELLDLVGLSQRALRRFPHEFSGGQRQRIAIARALALNPLLIVLDEPVSSLDVSIRGQILNLLLDLQRRLGITYLFIAHDLAAVAYMSHEVAVMYLGRIVEIGDAERVALAPQHPYTKALFSAALPATLDAVTEEIVIIGELPNPINPPSGCRFHPRCPYAMAICTTQEPMLRDVDGRIVACHLAPIPAQAAGASEVDSRRT